MRPIYTPFFIAVAILACFIAIAFGQAALPFSESMNGAMNSAAIAASYDISKVVNESDMLFNSIAFKDESSEGEEFIIIGEVAISSAVEKLENLSRGEGSLDSDLELIETGELAILYSDMSHSLGIEKIPIVLVRPVPQRRIMPVTNLSRERAMLNGTATDENLFLSLQPAIFTYEISEGKRESSSGVDVIWS